MPRLLSRSEIAGWSRILTVAVLILCAAHPSGADRKFYDDDPLSREPETRDASGAKPWDIPLMYDLMFNLFVTPRDKSPTVRAGNVNTVDEVPDSNWFTNRILARPISVAEAVRGPNTIEGPASGRWTVIATKSAGVAPGFTIRDQRGIVWFVSFDGAGHSDAATAAVVVATKLFWALGYHQVESYLATLRAEDLAIDDGARVTVASGKKRQMRMDDVRKVLARADRAADGSYRVVAGRAVEGKVLGGFRDSGTRPDDPNDIVPHENRRELRALKVFGAWTNLVDMKAGNTLDSVIVENGRSVVRHYLQDVGSTFGTGALGPREWDEGYDNLFDGDPTWKRFISMNFFLSPWQTVPYTEYEAVGRFEGEQFVPERWKSRVPMAAALRARADDTFWAARRVAAFGDDLIRAIVHAGQFHDAEAERHLVEVLIQRRDKIARAYLPAINPVINPRLAPDGSLSFENAAVAAGVAEAPAEYRASWSRFDNATGQSSAIAETRGTTTSLAAPGGLPANVGDYLEVAVASPDAAHPSWTQPVRMFFRRTSGGWTLAGLERQP